MRKWWAVAVFLAAAAPHAVVGQTRIQGQYRIVVEEYADRAARTRHYIQNETGRTPLVIPTGRALSAAPGSTVQLAGTLAGQSLTVSSEQLVAPAAVLPDTLGEQKVAVILIKYQDDPVEPITVQQAHDLVFGSVNQFYRTSSFDQAWLAGQVFGWLTVPYPRSACTDAMLLSGNADQQLVAQGVPLSSFRRKIYLWPKNGCSWTGLALVGENPSMAWVNGSFTLKAIGHELGHGFGLRHAHAMECDPTPVGDNCAISPYGDVADLMGNVRAGDFSPYAKERLGWLGDGVSPDILHASQTGRYTIHAYASASLGPKALRIPRGANDAGQQRYFYVSFRNPVGLDSVLSGSGNWHRGVMFHAVDHGNGDSIHQLDMAPTAGTLGYADLNEGALEAGRSFTDPVSKIVVSVASVSADQAVIDVAYPAPPPPPTCQFVEPSLTWSSLPSVKPGTEARATVVVKNRLDPTNAACQAQSMTLSLSLPSRWSGSAAPTTLTLSPGASATVQVGVSSPNNQSPGQYPVSLVATLSTGQQVAAATLATIQPSCSPRPPRYVVRWGQSGSMGFIIGVLDAATLACNASTQTTSGSNLETPTPIDTYNGLVNGWKPQPVVPRAPTKASHSTPVRRAPVRQRWVR